MTTYAQLPSGIIAPQELAKSVLNDYLFGNHGAYRTARSTNKNTMGWETSSGSADTDTLSDLATLRSQSRDLVRNEALPSGAIATVVTSVVGTGIVPQCRLDHEFLGISEAAADAWQRKAERIFKQTADKPHWDAEGRENFWQQQSTVERSQLESGDVFAVRRYIERPGKLLGLAVQLVEADRVDTPLDKRINRNIRAGIEFGSDGYPAGFHIAQEHPGESTALLPRKFTRIDAFDKNGNPLVLAVIKRLRPGQTRGVPYLAAVIEPLKQLARYTEAEITAAVLSGMFAVFVTSPAAVSPLPGGLPGVVNGKQSVPAGNGLQRLQSGMIVDLAPGEEIKVAEATRPNTAFDPFVQAVLRQIGVALELPFEILIKHYTASYSAARAAIIEAWRFFLREREFLVQSYCQPCWEWVITEAIARGLLEAPGFFDDLLVRAAWLGTEWVGQGMPSIDPVKDAEAATRWNALNVLPLQTISAQQGRDFDRDFKQVVREQKLLKDSGLHRPNEQILPEPGQQTSNPKKP